MSIGSGGSHQHVIGPRDQPFLARCRFLKKITYVRAETKKNYPDQNNFTYADLKNDKKTKEIVS